ncbi:septum formation initiator family protein [Streptomyces sp. NPDC018833]|uniref:septum formation initiator family protein n=1 Tax=Streptomyces sp. NPDC018833 TaxID=3365053 RepID=UPI0037A72E8A
MSTAARQLKGRAARLARLMPSGPSTAARTPFVVLVVLLLSGGLITLLLLNSSLSQGSFELSELKKRTTELTDQQQALQRDVDSYSAPDALERRARELGMVPGGSPAFLGPDGTVRGVPGKATALPSPDPEPQQVQGTAASSATPSASAPASQSALPATSASASAPAPAPGASSSAAPSPQTVPERTDPLGKPFRTSPQPTPTTTGR